MLKIIILIKNVGHFSVIFLFPVGFRISWKKIIPDLAPTAQTLHAKALLVKEALAHRQLMELSKVAETQRHIFVEELKVNSLNVYNLTVGGLVDNHVSMVDRLEAISKFLNNMV